MATMNADAWQQSGARPDRYAAGPPRPQRGVPLDRAGRPVRGAAQPPRRAADRGGHHSQQVEYSRGGSRRPDQGRSAGRGADRAREPQRRPSASADRGDYTPRGRAPAPERGGRVPGVVAVIGIFLITLAGAAVDSFVGIGLGLITLGALVGSTVIAALVVRRRDLASVVVAPPLVFVAVAGLNIALAPSASLNTATVATLLIRGFPTMGIATGAAIVLALGRLIARR